MRLKSSVITIILMVLMCSCATLPVPINEKPMYGGINKNPELTKANELFIREATQSAGSRDTASKEYSKLGWKYFYNNDHSTAMKRFNQAWLLDNNNPEAYWGFAIILQYRGEYEEALAMFERAYNMAPDIPRLAGNYALALAQKGRGYLLFKNSEDDKILNKSEAIFNRILKENSAEAVSYAQAAVAFYYHRKYEEAWDKLCTALKMGGEKSVNPSFIEDLKRKMPSPCENL